MSQKLLSQDMFVLNIFTDSTLYLQKRSNSSGEQMHIYVWLSPFAVHLKLLQHCSSAILQYKIKSKKQKQKQKNLQMLHHLILMNIFIVCLWILHAIKPNDSPFPNHTLNLSSSAPSWMLFPRLEGPPSALSFQILFKMPALPSL